MKRNIYVLLAWALVLTLSQCKKDVKVLPEDAGESVAITLNVKDNNGAKGYVTPDNGAVAFESGDNIYVACAGRFVGELTYNGTNFSGTITNATTGSLLDFYYFGSKRPVINGDNTSCSIDISDQSENYSGDRWHLPVISFGSSNETYGSVTSYTATLHNKCALVKFRVYSEVESTDDIYISGVNHLVDIAFNGNEFTYGKYYEGYINLGKGVKDAWAEKWVILLPQEALPGSETGAYIGNDYSGYRSAIPAISANSFLTSGIDVTINEATGLTPPNGATRGLFSISSSRKVWFSQGNIQNSGTSEIPSWQFAQNQWDYYGTSYDQFDWYVATNMKNNVISNCGKGWYTLNKDQWVYLLNSRGGDNYPRYVKAVLHNVNGLLILPDGWKSGFYVFENINVSGAQFNSNVIPDDKWPIIAAKGAVFMPVGGIGSSYWTATSACSLGISTAVSYNTNTANTTNYSIRLVQDYSAK